MSSSLPLLPFARHRDLLPLDRCGLVVIDFQRVFTDPGSPAFLDHAPRALEHAIHLVKAFRRARRPVAFTRHVHRAPPRGPGLGSWWSHFILDSDPLGALDPRITPESGEAEVRKQRYSALYRTRLASWLAARDVSCVVLAGVMTHVCVDSTARDAISRGFDVVVAGDACASKTTALHEASLLCLSHAVSRVVTVSRLVAALRPERT